jgi:outer membrane protein TolC
MTFHVGSRSYALLFAAGLLLIGRPTSGAAQTPDAGAETPEDILELSTLVEQARTDKDLLAEFEAKQEKAEWKKYQAKWSRGPKFQATTGLAPVPANADPDRLGENIEEIGNLQVGPLFTQDISMAIPIYTFGRIGTLKELADIGVDVAGLKRRQAILQVIFQTKRAYYSLRLSRAFEDLLQEGDERIEEQIQQMQDARDFGTAEFETEDLRKLQIFGAEVDERIADNRKLERVATDGLQYLTRVEATRPPVGELDSDSELPTLEAVDTYLEAAQYHRPELAQLNKAVRAQSLQVRLEKQQFLPNVGFGVNFGYSVSTEETARQPVCRRQSPGGPCENTDDLFARPDSDPLDRLSLTLGLSMRWQLDPLVQKGELKEVQAKLREVKAQRARAQGAIKLQIRKQYAEAADAREKIDIQARRLEAARRWRDQLGLSLETAGTDIQDMEEEAIKPLKAYYEAKAKHLEARYNYLVARAALAQAVGVDYLSEVAPDGSVPGTKPLDGSRTSK